MDQDGENKGNGMNESEVREQESRISKYRKLEKVRNEIGSALHAVTEPWEKTGPCGQGPFTGNTRESRRVISMKIQFSATLGGAAPVDIEISNMHIKAYELGRALESMLRSEMKLLNDEMEKV